MRGLVKIMDFNEEYTDIEQDQVECWLKKKEISTIHKEPKLNQYTVETIKNLCDVLQQSDEVFIVTVDILEDYLVTKPNETITNSMLALCCAILVSAKLVGSRPEITINALQRIMLSLTNESFNKDEIKEMELTLFVTIGKLPLTTVFTDVNMLLQYYFKVLRLNVDLRPLCTEVLNLVYTSKKYLFSQIKQTYASTKGAKIFLKQLISNKFYYPCGIILCSIKLSKMKNVFNLEQIAKDMQKFSSIHADHLLLLCEVIYKLFN